jgi:hypothetical protein
MLDRLKVRVARAILASAAPPAVGPIRVETPDPEQVSAESFALNAGPPIGPQTEPEKPDNLEDRERLCAILLANPSGLSGYELLDRYRIPPACLEAAMLDGQVGKAERGLGATGLIGGPWAPIPR